MEERKLQRRKEKAAEDRNNDQLAQACRSLGDFYNQQGRYDEACMEYIQASNIFSKLKKQLEVAKSYRMVAEMYMLLSEFEKALKHVNIFLKIVQTLGNKVETQRAYATLGRAYLLQGQHAGNLTSATRPLKLAEKAFIQSLLVCKELTGHISKIELLDMQARLYLNIGVVREHMEDFDDSIQYMEKAIKICKVNDIYELLHLCYISVGLLYHYKKFDTSLALRFCNLALEISERLPNRTKKECETLIFKAEIMIQEGDFQSAKQILHKAYKLKSPEINDRHQIERQLRIVAALSKTLDSLVTTNSDDYVTRKSLYERMGDGCCLLLNYKKAIDYYLKMLESAELSSESPKDLVPTYVSLYQTYKDNKQYEQALEYLWKEYEVNKDEPIEAFNTLCNIGEIYELESKPFWTTQDCYQKAIAEARKINSVKMERIASIRLMKLQQKFNMYALLENLKDETNKRGIDLNDDDSDSECGQSGEHNTPNIGDEISLNELTDSDEEKIEHKSESSRPQRKRNVGITIKRNNKGETQLHQACIAGNLELARRLIEQGHVVNVRDHAGWLPLHEASNHGFRDIVELLLDNGATAAINDKGGTGCDGITPLYDACSNGCLDIAELLLERGANATLKTDLGDTTLNVFDKWRNTANLDPFEQSQYERIRSRLVEQLNKTGMLGEANASQLTTPIRSFGERRSANGTEPSLETLRRLARDSGSEYSDEEVRRHSRNDFDSSDNELDETLRPVTPVKKRSPRALMDSSSSNAKQEYQSVMEGLKHPKRSGIACSDVVIPKKRAGFLDPDDVDDDWLIDDLRPDKKKRKLLTDRNVYGTEYNSKTCPSSKLKENRTAPYDDYDEDDDSQDAFKILLESKGVSKKNTKNKLPRSSSLTGSSQSRKQSSLLESGFCRFRSESPQSLDENEIEPDSTTTSVTVSQRTPQKEPPTAIVSTVSFKIKVEDEMLLIPIEKKKLTEANIRWLAEEASRRYYNLVGLRPVLRLMTTDGFAFEENDVINVALEHNVIAAKVLEWKIAPLSQRYEEMCTQLQLEMDDNIKSILEKSQSNCILLNNEALTPELTLPIFKALLHQSSLRVLDLSNNFIRNEGCEQLSRSLGTLKQLKTLNLRGNCITAEGLSKLTTANLGELEELYLSYNPLGNSCIKSLEKICEHSNKLKKLHLSSCNITSFYDFDLHFSDLTDFDISFNNMLPSALKSVMSKLNSCRMQCLNFNFAATADTQFPNKLLEFLQNGTCEKFCFVEVSGCHLSDLDVFNITSHLSKSSDLEKVNFSANSKLTPTALQHVFDNVPQLKIIEMENCWQGSNFTRWNEITMGTEDRRPEMIILSAKEVDEDALRLFWDTKHGSRAKMMAHGELFKMYINECDVK